MVHGTIPWVGVLGHVRVEKVSHTVSMHVTNCFKFLP